MNEFKKEINKEKVLVGFKNRDIFYIKMGQNIVLSKMEKEQIL